jgi:cation transport ATPase
MVRLADRFALWFLALTVLLAGGTWVVENICGCSRCWSRLRHAHSFSQFRLQSSLELARCTARRAGQGWPVLETLARASVLVIDKTSTLTGARQAY